jgi:hypothetical protein
MILLWDLKNKNKNINLKGGKLDVKLDTQTKIGHSWEEQNEQFDSTWKLKIIKE